MILTTEILDIFVEMRVVSILCEKLLSKQIDTICYNNDETGAVIKNMKATPRITINLDLDAKQYADSINTLIIENSSLESKRAVKIEALTQLYSDGLVDSDLFMLAYQKYETEN